VVGLAWPLAPTVFALGLANGVFAVAAIGSMMGLAGAQGADRSGARMGVWGGAQAGAFAVGGFLGASGVQALRGLLHEPAPAFVAVFGVEALIFLVSAVLAARLDTGVVRRPGPTLAISPIGLGGAR
jgi:BCD family chlorophyll transporter-like MFS transporter